MSAAADLDPRSVLPPWEPKVLRVFRARHGTDDARAFVDQIFDVANL